MASKRYLIGFVLDQSGSMRMCYDQTISGFNEFLDQQKKDPNGEAFLSLTLFETIVEARFSAVPIAQVPELGTPGNTYNPNGMTALYDSVGTTIREIEKIADQYDKVLVVIQTDGGENSSREWSRKQIFDLITEKRKEDGADWSFAFMGADQDAYLAGSAMGVAAGSTMSYASASTGHALRSLSASVSGYRMSGGAGGQSLFSTDPEPEVETTTTVEADPVPTSVEELSSDSPSTWRKS